ncbi:MAG: hypothetical protein A2177_10910 [Spirochaetes bacterium RBG_13_68_11]|nr:MAG: hypothetical protein A2177_10910 [Spirochaetes bacterium RBG_13_68_11]
MKKIVTALSLAVFLFTGFIASAQTQALVLPVSKEKPTIDGVSVASEYPVGAQVGKMKLWLSRTTDTVYAAVSGETTGWVAMGFGSPKMDGALMFIGFVSGDGKSQLKIQKGAGHSHGDVESDALVQFAMKEEGGVTTLELAIKASSVIGKGAADLPMIFAMGGADSFTSLHRARSPQQVKLQ